MKVIFDLAGKSAKSAWADPTPEDTARIDYLNSVAAWLPQGSVLTVRDEVFDAKGEATGFTRQIDMIENGIVIHRGSAAVSIPITEILKLAERVEPALRPSGGS